MNPEQKRLQELHDEQVPWQKWGPYLSERQWGTVREDYSNDGDAWDYFPHDQARSRAYRWGEDGLAGISDDLLFLPGQHPNPLIYEIFVQIPPDGLPLRRPGADQPPAHPQRLRVRVTRYRRL